MKGLLVRIGVSMCVAMLAVVGVTLALAWDSLARFLEAPARPTFAAPDLDPPPYDPGKMTALVLASNVGTEITDFLAPYEILARSGRFNVYAVAPERVPSPFWPEGILIPHYSFAEFDALEGAKADLVVVPNLVDPDNPAIHDWLRQQANAGAAFLSVCEGARTVAAAGLLVGAPATSHAAALPDLIHEHPSTNWVSGQRFTDGGKVISTAGVTAAVDGTIFILSRMAGNETAAEVAEAIGFVPAEEGSAGYTPPPIPAGNLVLMAIQAAYCPPKAGVAVPLYDGMGEMALAAVLDGYGRTGITPFKTVAGDNEVVKTAHGLYLAATTTYEATDAHSTVMVPGASNLAALPDGPRHWLENGSQGEAVFLHTDQSKGLVFRPVLERIAATMNVPTAEVVAAMLEFPLEDDTLEGPGWPVTMFFYMAGIAFVAGVGCFALLMKMRPSGATTDAETVGE